MTFWRSRTLGWLKSTSAVYRTSAKEESFLVLSGLQTYQRHLDVATAFFLPVENEKDEIDQHFVCHAEFCGRDFV